ncbi:hypothetical protein D3C85_1018230 [compost metagenome]
MTISISSLVEKLVEKLTNSDAGFGKTVKLAKGVSELFTIDFFAELPCKTVITLLFETLSPEKTFLYILVTNPP